MRWIRCFAGSTGWLDTYKKAMKWKVGEFYARARAMAGLARILFGRERGEIRKTGSAKMAGGSVIYQLQGLTLRFAVNIEYLFLNKYLYEK